ncbi:Bud-site selection protein [Talaromyces proteolyticus]|uniref:Bud-site selection protein n=1 Tax=Talaromyces proteolyticus TaxID=1131652 RepID=A0AAD4KEY7_9EURO|nr:Bud-site selection protein [Talaromyces proteolyticus]KAH8689517.1 Bud-site selection protein [Talaromyces proteolyticus]
MSKRKHSEIEDSLRHDDSRDDRANNVKAMRLRFKFERGTQLLFRALKTARGFERQKLGRRQKNSKKDEDSKAFERQIGEVQALKNLNLEETAHRYLFKQLAKIKRIAESPEFARLKKTTSVSTTGPRDPAEANVTARLFKSNPVQNVLPEILDGIRSVLGVEETQKKESANKTAGKVLGTTKEPKQGAQKQQKHAALSDNEPDSNSDAELTRLEGVSMGGGSDDESMDLAQFNGRLAAASDESDIDADSEIDIKKSRNSAAKRYDAVDDPSPSASGSESRSISVSPPPPKVKGYNFPTITYDGGYWSGSESGDEIDTPKPEPPRKNRMGQQARRALWEKKYGNKANHLHDDKNKGKDNKNSGWDMRRGATDGTDNQPRWAKRGAAQSFRGKEDVRGNNKGPSNRTQPSKTSKQEKANAPLHPSWEAARKAKQEKAQASFQGKKIVFD